ncbi:MAG: carbohydrate ABC transporter substrate-binding protein, partial [Bauldia sp.]|nr:carbohydrate ABC transporter substrate-binding protein [Bauldia sp.]
MKLRISLLTFTAGIALAAGSAMAADLKFPIGEDSRFSWQSYEDFAKSHDLSGQTLSIFGPWLGPDKDLVVSMLAYFEEATGATVEYAGSDSFEQQIVIDTQAGSPPNIAVFPQPGLAADLASKGDLVPLGDDVKNWLIDNYAAGQSWVDLSSYKGKDGEKHLYAFPYKADLKSLVWYVPENFADAGYEVPQTMEDLKALTEQIVADG